MQGDMPKNVKAAHFGGIRSAIITWNDSFAPHTRQVHNPARQLTGLENMCGRYSLICIDDLGNRFRVHNPMIGARSKFNVAPASEMPVIVQKKMPEIALMRWGLVPHWTKDSKTAPKPVNARAESLAEKPMFAPLLQSGRCLVPASGFYEWKKEGTHKAPFYFHLPNEPLFAFAGLYDTWHDPDGAPLMTYTIITCNANPLLAEVHDRMPVILTRENEERWLSYDPPSVQDLARILVPYPASAMARVAVSDLVNSPAVDDERVIRPLFGLT
jgi:putative SOS response-associated peptidase YedK